jgi:hypothetical protein
MKKNEFLKIVVLAKNLKIKSILIQFTLTKSIYIQTNYNDDLTTSYFNSSLINKINYSYE